MSMNNLGSTSTPRGAQLIANLPNLQNLIKRDPAAYVEEFQIQWNHYESVRQIFELGLASEGGVGKMKEVESNWRDLVGFIAQVAPCYPKRAAQFPSHLSNLLLTSHTALAPDTRKTLVQSLVLLRNRSMMSDIELLKILFPLLGMTPSPNLRSFILKTILSDIKTANKKGSNHKLNRLVQGLLFDMVQRGIDASSYVEGTGTTNNKKKGTGSVTSTVSGREAMLAVKLSCELWKKNIWADAKTVQIVALACFHPNTKVQNAAIHFFLATEGDDQAEESDEETEAAIPDIKKVLHQNRINKTRRSTVKNTKKTVKESHKKRKRNEAAAAGRVNFSAVHLLNDPQTFVERLYDSLQKHDRHFTLDHKVLIMQLFGRVTGLNKLCVLGFYSYATKYLTHHQLQVTSILVALASSVHDLTPPDVLTPVIRKLAHEFVHPGVASEVISAGLNSIREICRRQPLCMEKDLLEDLVEYKKSRDKGVMIASRALLALYRDVNPDLLRRRERGKAASMAKGKEPAAFGHSSLPSGIEGLELLQQYRAEKVAAGEAIPEEGDEAAWTGWEHESDDESGFDSDGNGWTNVGDGDSDIELSDSDEEGSKRKKAKKAPTTVVEEAEISDEDGPIKFTLKDASDDEEDEDSESDEDMEEGDGEIVAPEEPAMTIEEMMASQILTPADFAKLNELRLEAAEKEAENGGGSAARRKLQALQAAKKASEASEFLTETEIIGFRKHQKDDYETRMASIQSGREGRGKFGSKKGQMKVDNPSSSTNVEKSKKKNFMMIAHSNRVKSKKHASLRDTQKKLRSHVKKQKNRMK